MKTLFIFEGKIEDFVEKNKQFSPYIEQLKQLKSPIHLNWIVKIHNLHENTIQEIISEVLAFEKIKNKLEKKDLFSYKNLEELSDSLRKFAEEEQTQLDDAPTPEEYKLIYQSENWKVIYPKTEKASCYYGRGTVWCTAATKSLNYFNNYSLKYKVHLYYIIKTSHNKIKPPNDKINVSVINNKERGLVVLFGEPGAIVNSSNQDLSEIELKTALGSEFSNILKAIQKDASQRKQTGATDIIENMSLEEIKEQIDLIESEEQVVLFFQQYVSLQSPKLEVINYIINYILSLQYSVEMYVYVMQKIFSRKDVVNFESVNSYTDKILAGNFDDTYWDLLSTSVMVSPYCSLNQFKSLLKKLIDANKKGEIYFSIQQDILEPIEKFATTKQEILIYLLKYANGIRKSDLLSLPNISKEVIQQLSVSKDYYTILGISRNKNTPTKILKNFFRPLDTGDLKYYSFLPDEDLKSIFSKLSHEEKKQVLNSLKGKEYEIKIKNVLKESFKNYNFVEIVKQEILRMLLK